MTAGLSISVATTPISRIKVQQQLSGTLLLPTVRDVTRSRTLYVGYRMTALFEASRGVYMMSYSALKQSFEHGLNSNSGGSSGGPSGGDDADSRVALPLFARTIAGAGANVITWGLMYPFETIRSVQQARAATLSASSPSSHGPVASAPSASSAAAAASAAPTKAAQRATTQRADLGVLASARSLVAEGGLARLYRGFGPTMLRAGPVAGIILPMFELVLPRLEALRER